jgi:hypothetical protein
MLVSSPTKASVILIEGFHCYPQSLQANAKIEPRVGYSCFLPIHHHSSVILTSEGANSHFVEASVNPLLSDAL